MTATPDPSRGAEPRTLNHFAVLRLTAAWWRLERADRCRRLRALQEALAGVADVLHLYQVFPLHDTGDLLAWTALRSAEPERVHAYFGGYARALAPLWHRSPSNVHVERLPALRGARPWRGDEPGPRGDDPGADRCSMRTGRGPNAAVAPLLPVAAAAGGIWLTGTAAHPWRARGRFRSSASAQGGGSGARPVSSSRQSATAFAKCAMLRTVLPNVPPHSSEQSATAFARRAKLRIVSPIVPSASADDAMSRESVTARLIPDAAFSSSIRQSSRESVTARLIPDAAFSSSIRQSSRESVTA